MSSANTDFDVDVNDTDGALPLGECPWSDSRVSASIGDHRKRRQSARWRWPLAEGRSETLATAEQYADRLAFIGGLDVRILETNDRYALDVHREHMVY